MADQQLPSIPSAGSLTGAELLYLVQSGADAKVLLSALVTYIMTFIGNFIPTSLAGTTAGTVSWGQVFQGSFLKKFLATFSGYQCSSPAPQQTITFPTPFTTTPVFLANTEPPCTVTTTVLTLPTTTGAVDGTVILEGT